MPDASRSWTTSVASLAVTLLATTPADFAAGLERVKPFVQRLHIDLADGELVPTKTINLAQVYDIDEVPTDLHLMLKDPSAQTESIISFGPSLVICHAEATGDLAGLFQQLREVGIKVGLALEAGTTVDSVKDHLADLDHLLIFTGDHIGFNHSKFQPASLTKIAAAKAINPKLEVGVDGGINIETAEQATSAGADVINTGGFVHDAPDPAAAYAQLAVVVEAA